MTHGSEESRTKEFISGLLAAMVSISVNYPVTKLIYRQILEKASFKDSVKEMRNEGLIYLFRGLLPPLIQRSSEVSVMFGVYKTAELAIKPLKLSKYKEKTLSSAISGVVQSVLTPFERLQILLINHTYHDRLKNTGHGFVVLIKFYGAKELYRGYSATVIRNVFTNSVFFLLKDEMNNLLRYQKSMRRGTQNFLVGASVGMMLAILLYPLKVVKTIMQQELGGKFKSIFQVSRDIYKYDKRGIRNFYHGMNLNIVRTMLGWGITNVSYEFIRNNI